MPSLLAGFRLKPRISAWLESRLSPTPADRDRLRTQGDGVNPRLLRRDGNDGTVKLWDVATGQETLSLPVPYPWSVALTRDGRKLAVATNAGEVRIYDSALGYDTAN